MIQWLRELFCHFFKGGHDWKFVADRDLNQFQFADQDDEPEMGQARYVEEQCTKCKTTRYRRV